MGKRPAPGRELRLISCFCCCCAGGPLAAAFLPPCGMWAAQSVIHNSHIHYMLLVRMHDGITAGGTCFGWVSAGGAAAEAAARCRAVRRGCVAHGAALI